MLITCPSCGASYDVPDSLVRDTRKVRCARCRTQWSVSRQPDPVESRAQPPMRPAPALAPVLAFGDEHEEDLHFPPIGPASPLRRDLHVNADPGPQPPPRPEVAAAPDPAASGLKRDGLDAERRERATRLLVGLGWLGTVVVLAGLIWAGYHFRSGIVQAWPASERLYAALGWRITP